MALTDKQLNDVCNVYGGPMQCRYLSQVSGGNHVCLKLSKAKSTIDKKVHKYVETEVKSGRDPNYGWEPIYDGGSCKGFIVLLSLPQGK